MVSLMGIIFLYTMLSYVAELPSTAWPCRLHHVEGQTVPKLTFHPDPFLDALKKFQNEKYGRKMENYKPPSEDTFASLLSDDPFDTPCEPSEEEIKLRTIHSEWIVLHAITRANLLKFEDPDFKLRRTAEGEQDVKHLVGLTHFRVASPSIERHFQLGQLNHIVRLCQCFDLKFDTTRVEWPLLEVEFNSLRPTNGRYLRGSCEYPVGLAHILTIVISSSTFPSVIRSVGSLHDYH
jgi:hypothetical protein